MNIVRSIAFTIMVSAAAAAGQATPARTPRSIDIPDLSPAVQDRFDQADKNHSGGLDMGEAAAAGFAVERNFNDIDADHDHIITLYEIGQYLAGKTRDWASADTDGNGEISREEAARSPSLAGIFTQADRDQNGVVRKEEYEAFSQTTLYRNVDLPYVVPNIINKKF
jgi:hypothetical protein